GLNDGLTQHEFNVYQFIKSTPTATASVISDSLSISLRSVERIIQKLKEKNMIQRVGSKKTGHWKVL
ncbi:MAG: winged helix-turn-helix transcriptional regulator, partial [Firmicutes bacterium]|nr:winged helix-turn-helix transcriptional regulator [Bacillota bacterium]